MQIYFLQFLGKINRIVKSYPDLEGYSSFVIQEIGALDATNFRYNDGITTSEVYNFGPEHAPDYVIIVNDEGVVTSRWYVAETKYQRYGQCRVSLRRDVLADFREKVVNATALIEKATVSDNDPAIYNQEQATFNMIKQAETLLKDGSESAWIVGYVSTDNSVNKKYSGKTINTVSFTATTLHDWDFFNYVNKIKISNSTWATGPGETFFGSTQNRNYNVVLSNKYGSYTPNLVYSFNKEGMAETDTTPAEIGLGVASPSDAAYDVISHFQYGATTRERIKQDLSSALIGDAGTFDGIFESQYAYYHSEEDEATFKNLDGKFLRAGNNLYKISVNVLAEGHRVKYIPGYNSSLYQSIKDDIQQKAQTITILNVESETDDIYVTFNVNKYEINLLTVDSLDREIEIEFTSSKNVLNDAPYVMFAIPFNEVNFKIGNDTYVNDPDAALGMAREIALDLMSSGALYDIQLLPYCPRQDLIKTDFIDLRSSVATDHYDYEVITGSQADNYPVRSFCIFAKSSSFTFDINEGIEITEKKVQNQCDSWRLCSPNYNGVFQFNAVKNNGVDYFNVDCTYRPYNPYIHVNPNFKELYGNDYDDARGLICSGDFSMPANTSKWLEYEAQNKNYQQSFDRSIQHMEVEQKYERVNQIVGAVAGTGTGVIGGAMAGGLPGAIAGGVLSAAGGVADVLMAEELRSEKIRYAKDQFAYNLENIKALPNTLAKVSAFNKNNKIFPFLEHYSCTEIEREAFRNVLKYDGMTVNRIGKIIDFLRDNDLQYIKARLIRAEDLHDDQHIVDYIASEMEKGAYYDTRRD